MIADNSLALINQLTADKTIGQTVVFTNGCFDILHAGHVRYLTEAKKLGHSHCWPKQR